MRKTRATFFVRLMMGWGLVFTGVALVLTGCVGQAPMAIHGDLQQSSPRGDDKDKASSTTTQPATTQKFTPRLKGVVILSRHGVRAPSKDIAGGLYGPLKWPTWPVPPLNLTYRGYALAVGMGKYYRQLYGAHLDTFTKPCAAIDDAFSIADNKQRTIMTAKALALGLTGDAVCTSRIKHLSDAASVPPDTLFHPVDGLCKLNRQKVRQSIIDYLGGSYEAFLDRPFFRDMVLSLQTLTQCCSTAMCSKDDHTPYPKNKPCTILDLPLEILSQGWVSGALGVVEDMAESLLLEWYEGFRGEKLAWGNKLFPTDWQDLTLLNAMFHEAAMRPAYRVRAEGSNMAAYILRVLTTIAEKPTAQPGHGGDELSSFPITFIVGHDTTFDAVGGVMGLTWQLPGYGPNQTPPAAGLLFEIYEDTVGSVWVEVYIVCQTADQMANLVMADSPMGQPLHVPVTLKTTPGITSSIDQSQSMAQSRVRDRQKMLFADFKSRILPLLETDCMSHR